MEERGRHLRAYQCEISRGFAHIKLNSDSVFLRCKYSIRNCANTSKRINKLEKLNLAHSWTVFGKSSSRVADISGMCFTSRVQRIKPYILTLGIKHLFSLSRSDLAPYLTIKQQTLLERPAGLVATAGTPVPATSHSFSSLSCVSKGLLKDLLQEFFCNIYFTLLMPLSHVSRVRGRINRETGESRNTNVYKASDRRLSQDTKHELAWKNGF